MSDHISGPRALAEPIADITDVYAFPSPQRPGRLVLVMNTLPFAQPGDHFSDGLIYRFRLRQLSGPRRRRRPQTVRHRRARGHGRRRLRRAGRGGSARAGRRGPHLGRRQPVVPCRGAERRLHRPVARLRRRPLGPVLHGRSCRVEDHRHRGAQLRAARDHLPRRQERPQHRRRARRGHPPGRGCRSRGRHRGDPDPRQVERPHRARRPARGQEPHARAQAVRPGQPRPRDPRPLQHGGRFPPRRGYKGAYRARLDANLAFWDGLDGKTDWSVDESGGACPARGHARRLPRRRRQQAGTRSVARSSRSSER